MRQAGLLAACGLVALREQVERLEEDHRLAARLASGLAQIQGVGTEPQGANTNMVFITVPDGDRQAVQEHMKQHGVLIGGRPPTFRLVVHRDVAEDDITRTIDGFAGYFRSAA